MTEDEFDPLPADMMRARTVAGLSLRNRTEYDAATEAEIALRAVADTMPGWLYDVSNLAAITDNLNRARFDYERAHPEEEATRV